MTESMCCTAQCQCVCDFSFDHWLHLFCMVDIPVSIMEEIEGKDRGKGMTWTLEFSTVGWMVHGTESIISPQSFLPFFF